jgi:hypothetical protein
MPARNSKPTSKPRQKSRAGASFKQISASTAQIVKEAACLLDEEVAAGIVAARQMQRRFQKERRIDPADFDQALQKFQADAHEVVTLLNDQFKQLRAEENADLIKRLVSNTHDVVDLAVEFIQTGAEIANQLAQTGRKGNAAGSRKRAR